MMTAEQLKALLHEHGWTLVLEPRRKQGKRFALARKRDGKRQINRYIKAENKFDELTEADVLAKIDVVQPVCAPGLDCTPTPGAANE